MPVYFYEKELEKRNDSNNSSDLRIPMKKRNLRYRRLDQSHLYFFIAGDPDQFINNIKSSSTSVISSSSFNKCDLPSQSTIVDMFHTYEYINNLYKKGTFISLSSDQGMYNFIPFSKQNYCNDIKNRIKIDPKYRTSDDEYYNFMNMIKVMNRNTKYEKVKLNYQRNLDHWVTNNGLIRNEFPYAENDNGLNALFDMFSCFSERIKGRGNTANNTTNNTTNNNKKPIHIHFFLNKRDHPQLRKDGSEAFDNIFDKNEKLKEPYRSRYPSYLPILSMNSSDQFLDKSIPTWEDWAMVSYWYDKRVFLTNKNKNFKTYPEPSQFNINWSSKIPIAVFRGSSTGVGTTIETNDRLFVCHLSSLQKKAKDGNCYLDAKITTWNCRPRKKKGDEYYRIIEKENYQYLFGEELSQIEQSNYKYILHISGHSCAYRLTLEMFYGSVILYFPFSTSLWFFSKLKPYVHYIPIQEITEECIFKTIDWCKSNDQLCKEISENARNFAIHNFTRDGMLDFLEETCLQFNNNMIIPSPSQTIKSVQTLNTITFLDNYLKQQENMKKLVQVFFYPQSNVFFQLFLTSMLTSTQREHFLHSSIISENDIQTKNTIINLYEYKGKKFISKKIAHDHKRDDLNQLYVAYNYTNKLSDKYSNFCFTYFHDINEEEGYTTIFAEHCEGETLFQILQNKRVHSLDDLISIWLQICCILEIAQQYCGFLHYDSMTWNFIIQENDSPMIYDYDEIGVRLYSKFKVILLDFGDSHVVDKDFSYYTSIPFQVNKSIDVLFLVFKSLENYFNILTQEYTRRSFGKKAQDEKQNLNRLRSKAFTISKIKKILEYFHVHTNNDDFPITTTLTNFTSYSKENVDLFNDSYWEIKKYLLEKSKYSQLLDMIFLIPDRPPLDFVMFLEHNNLIKQNTICFNLLKNRNGHRKLIDTYDCMYYEFFSKIRLLKQLLSTESIMETEKNKAVVVTHEKNQEHTIVSRQSSVDQKNKVSLLILYSKQTLQRYNELVEKIASSSYDPLKRQSFSFSAKLYEKEFVEINNIIQSLQKKKLDCVKTLLCENPWSFTSLQQKISQIYLPNSNLSPVCNLDLYQESKLSHNYYFLIETLYLLSKTSKEPTLVLPSSVSFFDLRVRHKPNM